MIDDAAAKEAHRIVGGVIGNIQQVQGNQAAYDTCVTYFVAYGVALRALVGPEKAMEHAYQLADSLAKPDAAA